MTKGHIEIGKDDNMELVRIAISIENPETHGLVTIPMMISPYYALNIAQHLLYYALDLLDPDNSKGKIDD